MSKSAILSLLFLVSFHITAQENWLKLNGPEGGTIASLLAKGDTLIAGTGFEHGLIFYSTNRGIQWTKADFKNVGRVADFDLTPDGGVIAAAGKKGVIKSFDLATWFNLHPGGQLYEFWSVVAGAGSTIYAGSRPGYFLGNSGFGWYNIFFINGGVGDLLHFNNAMYAVATQYIFKKEEPSGNWVQIFDFGFANGFTLSVDSENTIFLPSYNYFHVSTDYGNTWEQRDTLHILYTNSLYGCIFNNRLVGACNDETTFAGNIWGAIVSDDLGYTWRMSNSGLPPKISGFKLASSGTDTYIGTISDGIYKSTDYGDCWAPINTGFTAANVMGIDVDTEGNIYSAAYGSGVSKSTDNGITWNKISNGFEEPYLNEVYAYNSNILFAGSDFNLYKSTTGGATWVKQPPVGGNYIFKFYKDRQNRLYTIDYFSGIYRSTDVGNIWTRIMNNLPYKVMSLAFDSLGNIYAGARSGRIYKTTDDGANWVQVFHYTNLNATINGICVAPNGTIFATGCMLGIVRSTDNGTSWTNVRGAEGYYGIWPIVANSKGEIYSCTIDTILFSDDNGNTWRNITSNGKLLRVWDMQFDKNEFLYLGTDESVWRSAEPTPVELTQFTASLVSTDVILNWETATETNNKGFEIQRRTSPLPSPSQGEGEHWAVLGFVNGAGTTSETHSYSFTDKNLETGKYTYRLKQVDFDGSFEYSKEIEVEVNTPAEYSLRQNYPNPFNPTTTIEFSLPKEENVKLSLYSILGEELRVLVNEKMTAGMHKYTLDAAALPSGVYVYRLRAGGFADTKKLVVIK